MFRFLGFWGLGCWGLRVSMICSPYPTALNLVVTLILRGCYAASGVEDLGG